MVLERMMEREFLNFQESLLLLVQLHQSQLLDLDLKQQDMGLKEVQ